MRQGRTSPSRAGPARSSAGRALGILAAIAQRPDGVPFGELKALCRHVPRATLARQLKALVADDLAAKDERTGRYAIGEACRAFAKAVLGAVPRREVVQPVLEALAAQTGESVAYFELDGDAVVLLAKVDMPDSWHFIPVYARNAQLDHVANLIILAHQTAEDVDAALRLRGIRGRRAIAEFRRKLAEVRQTPRFNAVPVLPEGGTRAIGALVISHLADRSGASELREELQRAAGRAAALLAPHAP